MPLRTDEERRASGLERQQRYMARHRDEILARKRQQYADDPTQRLNAHKRYRERNRENLLARRRQKYAENREAALAERKEYRAKNRDAINVRAKKRYWANRDEILAKEKLARPRRTAWHRKKKYGLDQAAVDTMTANQGGVCAICGVTLANLATRYVHVDHDHGTGKVRGILCNSCNAGLGHFRDDTETLRRAIAYLELHS